MLPVNYNYEKLSRKEKKAILRTLDTIVDMNTPVEISKKLADRLLKELLLLGVFDRSNILHIESKKNLFQSLIQMRKFTTIKINKSIENFKKSKKWFLSLC